MASGSRASMAGRSGGSSSAKTLGMIRQIGTVDEFADELLAHFLAGLKLHIRFQLSASEESNLASAIEAAKRVEAIFAYGRDPRAEIQPPLFSIGGVDGPMRIRGKLGHSNIVVLLGSGSTHNYISKKLLAKEKLKVRPTAAYEVEMLCGSVETSGICRGVKVDLQACEISVDCIPFPLHGVDLLLGAAWLNTLEKTVLMGGSMEIELNGRNVKLVFDASLAAAPTGNYY